MSKVEEYRRHAEECRQLTTKSAKEEARTQLLQMADTWEGLARDREEQITRQERITALENNREPDGGAT